MTTTSSSEPRHEASLAKLTALFVVIFIVSLGVCGYSSHKGGDEFGGTPGFFSFIGMIVSVVCLIGRGIAALIRRYK